MPSHMVPVEKAVGEISAQLFAPSPPCFPLLVPGQRINKEALEQTNLKSVLVIKQIA